MPTGLHQVCFPNGLRGTLFGEPVRCSADDCMLTTQPLRRGPRKKTVQEHHDRLHDLSDFTSGPEAAEHAGGRSRWGRGRTAQC